MKVLLLRGQVPQDRNPEEIVFDRIEDNDDMWTQLIYSLSKNGHGQVWYWNGRRKKRFNDNFIERWMPSFVTTKYDFEPDIIFCRGGFKEYDVVLKRHPNAFKIYYGAGVRYLPKHGFKGYDMILVDSEEQLAEAKRLFPKVKSDLIIKPAAENIFYPQNAEIKYDIIFSVNHAKMKGTDFFFSNLKPGLKVVVVGNIPKSIRRQHPNVFFAGRVSRKELPKFYAQAKVAVCCSTSYDSCPRVIPEALACNTPIVVLDSVHVWRNMYINKNTGISSSRADFFNNVQKIVDSFDEFEPRKYYEENLSILSSTNRILRYL